MAILKGNHDSHTLSLVQIATLKLGRQEWILYRKDGAPPSEWTNYKLAVSGKCMHKANYHLSYNGERLANSRDAGLCEIHRPKLYEQALAAIEADTSARQQQTGE